MFQRWFKRNGTNDSTDSEYHQGSAHLIDMRQIIKTYHSAAGTFTVPSRRW